jgi:glycosyltransferase involved in cell wall biosynthesis
MKLSVAMITYNQERFIGQAIESVLAQKVNFDYEIVIGEDCSTDGTRAIVTDFSRRYPGRIVPLLRERNLGGPQNFLGTLAACRGQYLAVLEGDDYWTSVDKLQMQVDFLDAHPDRVSCCHRVKFLYETGPARVDVHPLLAAGPYTIEDLLRMNFVVTCSTVLRRDLIGPLPRWLFETSLGDWPLHAIAARNGKIELMDEIMATYRVHPGGTWSSLPLTSQLLEITRMLTLLDKHLGFQYTRTIRPALARWYLELACDARQDGSRMETGKHLVSCIRCGGLRVGISMRTFAGLAGFAVIGSWYKLFSRAKTATRR